MDIIQMKEKVAKDLELSYEEVDEVIDWVYSYSKTLTQTLKEIEFSGFGKIQVSPNKARKNLKVLSIASEKSTGKRKEVLDEAIEKLKNRKDVF